MLSPTAASVSFSSSGGSLWLNSTCGAVWLARRPSLNSYKHSTLNSSHWNYLEFRDFGSRSLTSSSSHLHENFANDDVVVVFKHRAEDHRHSVFLGLHVPGTAEEVRQIRMTAEASVASGCARSDAYMDSSSL